MGEIEEAGELLFFDTFSHESDTDINLDLVQFPKPVFITQVRIIPLGARVQADFPGGVRLGATNPSKFHIEFFVNDLGISGASTFENLGHLQYNQNDCIHLECNQEKIPTDGLVLRGWYSTITLAVYGILTNSLTDNIANSPPPPSEPEVLENIDNDNGENRNEILPEEPAKNDWKENVTGELSAHVHKSAVSDFGNDNMDYDSARNRGVDSHYGRHESGDERERERERHTRKRTPSSEHSPVTRAHTRAESNERDYLRTRDRERDHDKTSQEWSRSPDYSRRVRHHKKSDCSRSDLDESHKWPRTPPSTSIESPQRPRSPDYSDDESKIGHYKKLKTRSFKQSTESLNTIATASEPPVETQVTPSADDENPDTPTEQYEPILSDDEIIGDNADEDSIPLEDSTATDDLDLDIQAAADEALPAILKFDPFLDNIEKFNNEQAQYYTADVENLILTLKKFATQTKCDSITEFKASSCTPEERERFVFLCEELINQLVYLTQNFKRRQNVLREFCNCKNRLKAIYNVLYIAADFDCACLQTQPVFKIRHIKTGAKLIELLASYDDLYKYLLQVEHYDPFKSILTLLQQDYMALSIKLLLLKAIYALLDSQIALRQFLSPDINGYRLIFDLLQKTRPTRTKYALQALIKKLHLCESLSSLRELCRQAFVLCNYSVNAKDSYKILDALLQQILDALSKNSLRYQQPRRFLPVSKKFDLCIDPAAQRSFANSLQAYFKQHALAESLLLILSNASTLPEYLLLSTLDVLEALLNNYFGIDYLIDDCFDVTQILVAVLLGIDDIPKSDKTEDESINNIKVTIKTPKAEESKDTITIKEEENQSIEITAQAIEENKMEKTEVTTDMKSSEKLQISTGGKNSTEDDVDFTRKSTETESLPANKPAVSYLNRMQKLGLELAYKCQTRYHLDVIVHHSYDNEQYKDDFVILSDHLHALYSQTCQPLGRQYTVEFIGLNNNIQIFMDLVKKEEVLQTQQQLASPGTKYKSPVLSYAVDMIECCVRFCENLDYLGEHGNHILQLAKNHDGFEPSVSAVLQEMFVYVKPLETMNIFAYDDITPLVEIITRSLEYITSFPGDLIMALRILRHLAIGSMSKSFQNTDAEQLKHRYVLLQFYSADGLQLLIQILEKLYLYFEQPGLHAPALMTIQGLYCCQIILPALQVMREMLSFAIQCRDTEFKDLTAIDHLMRTYYLMYHYPARSQSATEASLARQEIIQILLAYTQPNEQQVDSLHKSLWTQMIREVLKNIEGPASLIPGLLVLAELLPLPLPIPLPALLDKEDGDMLKAQVQRLITERKLWSAHIHPQSIQIVRLLETLSSTTFPQLVDLFTRVCFQLADLAPNLTLLISKTLSDLVTEEWALAQNQPTAQLARLLGFYKRLNAYACLKVSTISILSGKLWDLFHNILNIKMMTDEAVKCQLAVHRIIEKFLDTEISFIASAAGAANAATSNPIFASNTISNPLLSLASALPPKELIPKIAEATFHNLIQQSQISNGILVIALRNLTLLTEHDITFYHLSGVLKQKSTDFQQWLLKILEMLESLGSYHTSIESVVKFLHSLVHIEEKSPKYRTLLPKRTLKLNGRDFMVLLGITSEDSKLNVIQRLKALLEKYKNEITASCLNDVQQMGEEVIAAAAVTCDGNTKHEGDVLTEPALPQTESIVTQYDARPIFAPYEIANDEILLSSSYWFQPLNIASLSTEEIENQNCRIACDLTELAETYLPQETNLTTDCKRVLHLSASPQSNRERTPAAPCFRTRRVEVEPTTGRPEKKIFVSAVRGRGFIRTPPNRGDLFRSRPPNTSRPPSLHVDDFLALETCGAQPTGPTGYNKIPTMIRGARIGRNRGARIAALTAYRKAKMLRTGSPSTWNEGSPMHYMPSSGGDTHYPTMHFSGRSRGRGGRPIRPYLR